MSLSPNDRNIKVWNIKNWECIFNHNINKDGSLRASCFLNQNSIIYIVSSHYQCYNDNSIKIFDLNGNKIKVINNSDEDTYFIETYLEEKNSKIYIITANHGYSKSYDFNENKLYHKYIGNDHRGHHSIIINNNNIVGIVNLIETSEDGKIRIWDFHSGDLLKIISVYNKWIHGICLWNNDLLFIGNISRKIILVELKTGKIIKEYSGHNNLVLTLKKIIHPKYGDCLVSQARLNDKIIIWKNKN